MTVPAPADPLATWTPQAALGLTCAGCHPEYRNVDRPEEWGEDRDGALPAPPDDHTETAPDDPGGSPGETAGETAGETPPPTATHEIAAPPTALRTAPPTAAPTARGHRPR